MGLIAKGWICEAVVPMAVDYQRLIADSVQKLSQLRRERRRLDDEIQRLQRLVVTMAGRSRASDQRSPITIPHSETLGLTEAVSLLFEAYDLEFTAVMVRDLLPTVGFDTSRYKEPLTSIHAILRRLVSRKIIARTQGSQGSTVYVRTYPTTAAEEQER